MITTEASSKLSRNEGLKAADPLLQGSIAAALVDSGSDHFSDDDYEFLKFHGVYQQDDRDKRKVAKAYSLMVRTRFPGGHLTAEQYLVCDDLATRYGNRTLRITTRQDFQFHGIIKSNLRQTLHALNRALVTTIAACGDVARNVTAPTTPARGNLHEQVLAEARKLSAALSPKTPAYHQLWIDGQEVILNPPADFTDPLYGRTYLPRKFKTGFAIPPVNDTDVLINDLGFVVISEGDRIVGYNLLAGGGLGMSHGNAQTYPRLADVVGFLAPEELEKVAKAVLLVHRDFGDRTNRKHARLKYVLEERGVDWFRGEVENRAGIKLGPARPFEFTKQGDQLGWGRQPDGRHFLGLFVENGRIKDAEGYELKKALRAVMEQYDPEVRLTPRQNIILVNIPSESRAGIEQTLARHGVSVQNPFSRIRLASMACPALPTCGLALAESERFLPQLLTRLETVLNETGLADEEIVVRMTGCPNGCSRPYTAEVAFVGKAPNKYQIYVGGAPASTRLNRLYKESVKGEDLVPELKLLLERFVRERLDNERFGDFCARAVWPEIGAPKPEPAVAA